MWKNYLKIAWRNTIRSKVFSLINIGGLALGLACCMLILLYITDEASFDRFQARGADLYRIKVTFASDQDTSTIASTNAIHGPTFKLEIPEIETAIRTQSSSTVFRKGDELLSSEVLFADSDFFKVFSFPLLAGDAATVLSDIGYIVLTEDMARSYFGTTDVLGKVIEIKMGNDFEPFTVSGVVKSIPQNSSIQFDSMISFEYQEARGWTDSAWMGFYMNTFVLLDGRADYRAVGEKMDRVFEANTRGKEDGPREGESVNFSLQPFLDIHLDASLSAERNGMAHGSNPVYSYILGAIGFFILVIACINFVNLAIARSLKRAKEVGIRKVVGGKRPQLILQFLSESFLLTFFAFVLAFLLTQLVLPTFNELANKQLAISYLLDRGLVFLFVALFLATGLIAGFYPAMVLSGFSPSSSLYKRGKLLQQGFLTKGLVVFQFTLSICLVVCTLVNFSQFKYLTTVSLGYNDVNLLKISGMRGLQDLSAIQQEMEALPGVASVAAFNGHYNGTGARVAGEEISFGYIGVDDRFLSTLEIPLVEGRNFSSDFPSDPTESIIVNEAFLREAGWQEGVGKEVDFHWKVKKMTVVGVIKDYHFASLREKIAPLVLTQDPKYRLQTLFLKLDSEQVSETLKSVEQVFRKHVPLMPFQYSFEDLDNLKRYEREAKWKQMITAGAMFSIFISCIGLFGLAVFNAEARIKEIGVRKVIGASVFGIVRLLSADFIKMVLIAILVAFPISYYAVQIWLKEFAYQVELSWWYFALTAAIGIGVAMLTVGVEAFRAPRMNPVDSLKSE